MTIKSVFVRAFAAAAVAAAFAGPRAPRQYTPIKWRKFRGPKRRKIKSGNHFSYQFDYK